MAEKSKTDVRRAAAERAAKLRAEQVQREKRNRLFSIVGIVVALVVVLGLVVWIMSQTDGDPLDSVEAPANTVSGGISFGAAGTPGSTNEGKPELQVFLDYGCVHCANLENINAADLADLADSGDATIIYKPMAITSAYAFRATNAVATVLNDEPENFLAFHNELFKLHADLAGGNASYEVIGQVATSVGVSADTVAKFEAEEWADWVQGVTTRANRIDKVTATPSLKLNGKQPEGLSWSTPGNLAAAVRAAG